MTTLADRLASVVPFGVRGTVAEVVGPTLAARGLPVPLGAECRVTTGGGATLTAEVVGFRGDRTLLLVDEPPRGVRRGDAVELVRSCGDVPAGEALLGRVLDARGRPVDGRPAPTLADFTPLEPPPLRSLDRPPIDTPFETGLRAVDGLLTLGRGQRVGLFAGSGVGKSTLLGQIVRGGDAEVNVVVLVGERGREVREFLERDLGPEGLAKSVVVVATGDESPLRRMRAARYGTALAEYFRDAGRDVLLVADSVTRFAYAAREVALAAGEPPATRGFPPSVFAALPQLLERSGRTDRGTITAIYTVLVEGDDLQDPVADSVRGTLDGHVVLSRKLVERAHWPAVDVPASLSRLMPQLAGEPHRLAADAMRRGLSAYRDQEDLVSIGAYQRGSDRDLDAFLAHRDEIDAFLTQRVDERSDAAETVAALADLRARLGNAAIAAAAAARPAPPAGEAA
ncbi:MAG: FliI/YscN family ATPase [Planctomycetota bacterium]